MADYILIEDHKRILHQLVRGCEEGKLPRTFSMIDTNIGWGLLEWKGGDPPKLELIDLLVLAKDGFLSLRVTLYHIGGDPSAVQCTLREKAFEAVKTGFAPLKEEQKQIDIEEQSNRVFVVHGHDDSMRLAVARTLEKLGLDPIILHEQPNLGRTIIEKFTDYSGVSFAIVLLSPDDVGRSRDAPSEEERYRARQNVILELGYFLGKLGRKRVVVLHQQEEKFEMPSDYSGVVYTSFDSEGQWQLDLVKELKACGYNVDANKLLD